MTVPYSYDFPRLIRESGFAFSTEKPSISINWSDIRVIDINKLIRERDFGTLDAHISEVLNCHLESEFNVQILDNGFVKLFRLSQLSLEYLLQCRRHLDLIAMALKSEMREVTQENMVLKVELNNKVDEIKKIQNKSRKRRRRDTNYGELSNILKQLNTNNSHGVMAQENKLLINKCLHCDKLFLNDFYLQSHIMRRHADYNEHKNDLSDDIYSPRDKISLEIKELKDRLNATEKMCQTIEKSHAVSEINVQKEEIESPEKSLKKDVEKDSNNESKMENMIEIFKKWKSEEDSKNEDQIKVLKEDLFKNINLIRDKLESLEKSTDNKNDDRLSIISNEINKQANELKSIKEDLLEKSFSNLNELKSQITHQEKFWENKLQALEVGQLQVIEELKANVMTYIGKSQNVYQHYQSKIDLLENKAQEQMETSLQHAKMLTKVADDTNKLILNVPVDLKENRLKNANSLQILTSHETLPPYKEKNDTTDEEMTVSKPINQKVPYSSTIRRKSLSNKEDSSDQTSSDNRIRLAEKPASPKHHKFNIQPQQSIESKLKRKQHKIVNKKNETVHIKKSSIKQSESDGENEKEGFIKSTPQIVSPKITKALKTDFVQIVNKTLNNLGVSSNEKAISTDKYKLCLEGIQNKKHLMSKRYKGYKKIEKHLLKNIDERLQLNKTVERRNSTQADTKTKPLSIMGSLISNVKSKAARISKSTEDLAKNFAKKEVFNRTKKMDDHKFNSPRSDQSSNSNKLSARSILAMIETKNIISESKDRDHKLDLKKKLDSSYDDSEYTTSSDDDQNKNGKKIITKVISHTPKSSIEDILRSPIKKPTLIRTVENMGESKNQLQSTGRFSKSTNESVSDIIEETSSIDSITTNDLFGSNTNDVLRRKSFSEDNILTASPKGVLKNVSSNSSLIKKKVYFDLEANKIESMSVDESVSTSIDNGADDLLDRKMALNESVLHLSTKQSPKIAEIAASIENQLISRGQVKPPVGSIETFFQAKSVQPSKLQGSINKITTEDNAPFPIPVARSSIKTSVMNNTNSDMELSDWSIDDLLSNNK